MLATRFQTNYFDAIHRLDEELGMKCDMQSIGTILYNEKSEDDLIEHEFDHLFLGFSNELLHSNPDEVMNYRWISLDSLYQDIEENAQKCVWFYILNRDGIEQFSVGAKVLFSNYLINSLNIKWRLIFLDFFV